MRKKILYAVGTTVLSLSLVGCSDKANDDKEANESAVEETSEETTSEDTETNTEETESTENTTEEISEESTDDEVVTLDDIRALNLEFDGVKEELLDENGNLDQDYFEVIVIYVTEHAFSNAEVLSDALRVSNEMVEGTGDSEEFKEVNEELIDVYVVSIDNFVAFFNAYEDVMTSEQIIDLEPISEHYTTVGNFIKLNRDNNYTLSLDMAEEFLTLNADLLTTFKEQATYLKELYDNKGIEME